MMAGQHRKTFMFLFYMLDKIYFSAETVKIRCRISKELFIIASIYGFIHIYMRYV